MASLKSKLKIYLGVDNNIFKEININEKKKSEKTKNTEDHVVLDLFKKMGRVGRRFDTKIDQRQIYL